MALEQGGVVAEQEMVRAADRDAQPAVRRQAIIDRLNVGLDLAVCRVGRLAVVAQQEHERPTDTLTNDAAQRRTVHIDAGAAPGIVMAELRGGRPSQGMAEHSYARQVESPGEPAGRIRAVQSRQLIECEPDVAGPRGQQAVDTAGWT